MEGGLSSQVDFLLLVLVVLLLCGLGAFSTLWTYLLILISI